MEIAIAADHGGFQLKEKIRAHLIESGYTVKDFGCYSLESVDFPEYAAKVGHFVGTENSLGVLCCGTGIGMSMAANKIKGVRAAVVSDAFSAMMTRRHNNSNVLCLGERVLGDSLALLLLDTWLVAEFEGGRHNTRLEKLAALEEQEGVE
ncbi:ribose 5-phosphate isomerase B [Listeria monocytogenes]|nr:ribose 5-phosphate isomerase B [Listeria monocytogenes]